MRASKWILLVATLLVPGVASAKPTQPTADLPGSHDSSLIGRFQGSLIVSYEHKQYTEFTLPLAKLEKVPGRKDNHNNDYFEPKQKKELTGAYTRLAYLVPPERSSLEVMENYLDQVKKLGGNALFQCRGDACGGDEKRGSAGGGGRMSLSMYLYPFETFTDKFESVGYCLMFAQIKDRRYLAAELPKQGAHLSVYTFSVEAGACDQELGNRTVALVQIVEGKERESRMTVPDASELARSISQSGRAAVYGIYFGSNRAEPEPESTPTLEQIAKLLQSQPSLKVLIVGHTDNVGGYSANVDLSQRRAKAVVKELSTRYKIAADRLTPVGVSSASPLDTNKTDEGRSKNRRVEIVEQ
jgi:outer membrane protein OmpA-like peptidoglycan-associated protein